MPLTVFAQIEDAPAIFRELTRLDGTWFMPTDRGDRLEVWEIADDSTMTGRGLRIKPENGDTVTLETLRLELRGGDIIYSARVRGQNDGKFVPFTLTEAGYDEYLFENPQHDDPKKIRYFLLQRRELQVTTEGTRNGRPTKQEYVFEREFNPASVEFRVRGGLNVFNLYKTNQIGVDPAPKFSPRPGWELGISTVFKGSGGFLSINVELGVAGKFSHTKAEFESVSDSGLITIRRDLTYNQTWLTVGLLPEVNLRRDGKFSLIFGPYYGRLLSNRVNGTEEPVRNKKVFNFNNDFTKNDFGGMLGLQWRQNFGKKDLEGRLGIRAQIGMKNIDNLYVRGRDIYNGRVGLMGISAIYSINILKL